MRECQKRFLEIENTLRELQKIIKEYQSEFEKRIGEVEKLSSKLAFEPVEEKDSKFIIGFLYKHINYPAKWVYCGRVRGIHKLAMVDGDGNIFVSDAEAKDWHKVHIWKY